jgi:hypothetical protein
MPVFYNAHHVEQNEAALYSIDLSYPTFLSGRGTFSLAGAMSGLQDVRTARR